MNRAGAGSVYVVSWSSAAGRVYGVYRTTNVTQAAWSPAEMDLSATTPLNTWTDPAPPSAASSGYRIKVTKSE